VSLSSFSAIMIYTKALDFNLRSWALPRGHH